MIFLYSTISSLKSMVGTVVITSPCPCWTSTSLAAAFFCTVFLLVLRLGSVVVLWFALPACCWLCSSACCWLCSFRFFSSSLQIFVFFSLSSYPCCLFFILLATGSLAVVPSVILSHHWLFGCGSFCASSPASLCGSLRLRGSFLASSTITTQRCALRD